MDETTSILDTKVSDLTVKQTLVVQLAAPIVVMGGFALAAGAFSAVGALARKFKKQELTIVTNDEE